ncbi:MAG: GNAT family N-acetyltransferase [Odoribacter sp.]|nr:GNAT family N-acetyltransferase [Odoribacter sp.]
MTELRLTHDLRSILEWRRRAVAALLDCEPPEEFITASEAYFEHTGCYDFYIAIDNGLPVGCGAVCYSREMPSIDNPAGRNAYITNIYTLDSDNSNQVYNLIVSSLIERARSKNCTRIFLESHPARHPTGIELPFSPISNMMILNDKLDRV